MAFNPSTDVIQEVVNAADPSRASLAAERLAALAAGKAPDGGFAASLAEASAAARRPVAAIAGLSDARERLAAAVDGADKDSRVKTEFEAMALGGFVNDMLPKETGGLFGSGAGGDMWRSMLADEIAKEVAKSGALGLSRRLFATHDLARTESGEAEGARGVTSANILSTSETADIARGAILSAGRKRA